MVTSSPTCCAKSAIYVAAEEGEELIMGYNVGHIELNRVIDEKLQLREQYAKYPPVVGGRGI